MWKDKQPFSHRTPWAVRPCRHVLLAMSCRHQGLECRTQGFSMGERNDFECLRTRVTLAGGDGSRETAYSLESRHARYSSFRPVWGAGEPPPSRHQSCSNPSSYLPSSSFKMVFLPSSPSDCTLQPHSRGCRQSKRSSSNAEPPDHPGRATRLFRPLFPGTRLRCTKGKRSSRTSLSLRASWLSSLLFFLLSPLLLALIDFLLIKATTTSCNSPCATFTAPYRTWGLRQAMRSHDVGSSHGVGAGAASPLSSVGGMLASQLVQPALWSLCAAAAELRIWPWLPPRLAGDCISVLFIVSARSFMQMLMNARPSFAPSRVPSTPPPAQPSALEFLFTVLQGISPLLHSPGAAQSQFLLPAGSHTSLVPVAVQCHLQVSAPLTVTIPSPPLASPN